MSVLKSAKIYVNRSENLLSLSVILEFTSENYSYMATANVRSNLKCFPSENEDGTFYCCFSKTWQKRTSHSTELEMQLLL